MLEQEREANLVDVLVEVAHLVAEHRSEATEDVAMQRVVLETHLRLHLAVLDADRAELRERLRRVERLARSPAISANAHL